MTAIPLLLRSCAAALLLLHIGIPALAQTGAPASKPAASMPQSEEAKPPTTLPPGNAAAKPAIKKHSKADPRPGVLLWRLQSKSTTVYLLGSLHVASADLYPLDSRIRDAYHSSTALVTELDVSPIGKEQSKRLLAVYGTYPDGDSLDRHIDASTRAELAGLIERKKYELDLSDIWTMRPWFASLTLTNAELEAAGFRADWGIEQHLRSTAGTRKVEILESMMEQVAIFKDMPEAAQVASLRYAVNNLDSAADAVERAQDAWKQGDAERFNELVVEPIRKANPALHARIFTERNRKMADAVERFLNSSGTYFVVVGSGHLTGVDSILALLEQRGHKPQRL